ncbi:serine hydroxymethyltransferase 1 [Microbotryum lychnidis-dioicae p1A1 Lamole]|uniref:Serine hydroxymethyltransferase n=1 Tax=Microbotryum lychnidis-dioicae (strain p1A1 Lamole / MvSl-1064) TaxID=683840 RepID=U5HC86_USTV1|nr:serine hydroxymethyltransferase 1 [Microbotryum lychnidis-dioicae p1A1 Lamole]|eukprot:KDE04809.1 serine hydroxymethyltransferase 1 [Microbotryum lychnidis-dioicae p1A1 Lamole]
MQRSLSSLLSSTSIVSRSRLAARPSAFFTSSSLRSFTSSRMAAVQKGDFNVDLYTPLAEFDPEVQKLVDRETFRQFRGLELIASENLTSLAVMEANGSMFTNKYSEGLPGARYYGGNEVVDELEILCQKRALTAFHLDEKTWGVNVQPYSGSTANFATFTALIQPQDRIMGLGLADGGHLTHGAFTPKRNISASSIYFQSMPYRVDPETGLIDYDELEKNATEFKPRILICGASAYPRDFDFARLRKIADINGSYLMMDMAHVSGLVAAQVLNDPFEYCDVVTTTTHKTLRGPRAGLIFFRKDKESDMEKRINDAVFPACQGGPHNNTIAGIAVTLKQVASPEFLAYAKQIVANTKAIAAKLLEHDYKLQTNGSDNHLVLWDLRPIGLTGSKIEKICDLAHITLNKNSVPGDKSATVPGGVRVGTNALTSRSMKEPEMEVVAEFLHRAVQIALSAQKECGSKLLKDFVKTVTEGEGESRKALQQLAKDVNEFAEKFPLPGVPDSSSIKRVEA